MIQTEYRKQNPAVRVDTNAYSILEKWKKTLNEKGIKVPLGATIREMDKILLDCDNGISKTDLKIIVHSLDKLKEILDKYNNPNWSDAIREMDTLLKLKDGD